MVRTIAALISGTLVVLAGISLGSLGVIALVALQLPISVQFVSGIAVFGVVGIGIVAGYVTGFVAQRKEVLHAVGVVAIDAGLFVLSLFVLAPPIPWTERLPGLLAIVVGVLLGGYLRRRQSLKSSSDR